MNRTELLKAALEALERVEEDFNQACILLSELKMYESNPQWDAAFVNTNDLSKLVAFVSAEYMGGYKPGDKCPCVSGTRSDGGGRELAQENCDFCKGTGRVQRRRTF